MHVKTDLSLEQSVKYQIDVNFLSSFFQGTRRGHIGLRYLGRPWSALGQLELANTHTRGGRGFGGSMNSQAWEGR